MVISDLDEVLWYLLLFHAVLELSSNIVNRFVKEVPRVD